MLSTPRFGRRAAWHRWQNAQRVSHGDTTVRNDASFPREVQSSYLAQSLSIEH